MRGNVLPGVAGAGLIVGLIFASVNQADIDQRDREIRESCMVVGAVLPTCPGLYPDIEVCQFEDCSDIGGNVGFWLDPSDEKGRAWYLTARPEMREAAQQP